MLQENELKELIVSQGFIPTKVNMINNSNEVVFESESLEDYLNLAKELKVIRLFYFYGFNSVLDYGIFLHEEEREDYPKNYLKAIDDYDYLVFTTLPTKPNELTLMFLYEGTMFVLSEEDNWIDDSDFKERDEKLDEFEEKFGNAIKQVREKKQNSMKVDLEKLRELIVNNEDFQHCTNKASREKFFWDNVSFDGEYSEFEYLVGNIRELQHRGYIEIFLDECWREVKARKK